ncbi:MAG: carboxypeptidase regulatory-like domain-containing protein [candidate division Zixibacteria bacterium]|nr:carboxypeptidase regulatory-like domain-containing protein [candidate division Zixibacteria bacterium]
MRKTLLILVAGLFLSAPFLQAENGQVYFRFTIESVKELPQLTRQISIDNVRGDTVWAYATDVQFAEFATLGYDYTILPDPGSLIVPRMATDQDDTLWNTYRSYVYYVETMEQFAIDYPTICVLDTIGMSVNGRLLLFAKISDNVQVEEFEPEVMHTGTMHGDETTGYILLLRLIDYLLVNYGTDPQVTNMVNNLEIWINPLANPDGTFTNNDSTVAGATRYNANYVDLNRNFPDPEDGPHPDGHSWQPETIAMMYLADAHNFVISANHHGGAEVVNYPWDTWAQRHADDAWFIDISRLYADSAQANSPAGYLTDQNNGITNGWDWYTIAGGRQDYMTYFQGGREVTIELSHVKLLPASQLVAHWNYNRAALLNYLENGLYGIKGIVTDSITGLPLAAVVTVLNHDVDSARVFTDPDVGDYHRMIEAGTFSLQFKAAGYTAKTITGVTVTDFTVTPLDVQLAPLTGDPILSFYDHDLSAVDPGDTASFFITLQNIGGGNANGVTATLSTTDLYTIIIQPISSYPTIIAEGGTGVSLSAYEFAVSSTCPDMHEVKFALAISADGGYSTTDSFAVLVGLPIEDFETADFSSFPWEMGGNADWMITSGGVEGGNWCARSGIITHNQTSEMRVTVTVGSASEISFYYKVSSESGWDYLKFYIDGSQKNQWSGEVNWTQAGYPVTAGPHTFKWVYDKDGSQSHGSDRAWVDFIIFPPHTQPLTIVTESLPDWTVDHAYSQQLQAEGGTGTRTFSDLYGDLAGSGLTLSSAGLLSGTPTATGLISFTALVVDQAADSASKPFDFTINLHVVITTESLPDGTVGTPYSQQLQASGGTGTKTWSDLYNDLAVFGLSLSASGLVSGTPTSGGTASFTAVVSDVVSDSAQKPLSITIEGGYLCGDADGNGMVNIADVVFLITYVFGGGPAPDPFAAGDVDCNQEVNVADIVYLIAYIFSGGPVPCADCP